MFLLVYRVVEPTRDAISSTAASHENAADKKWTALIITLRQRKVMRGKIMLSVRKASYPVGLIILLWNTNLHAQDPPQMQAIIDQTQRCTEVCDASGQECHAEHGGFSASCFRLAIACAQQCLSAGRQALNALDARWCISVVLVPHVQCWDQCSGSAKCSRWMATTS
jgi:hypothetical protein